MVNEMFWKNYDYTSYKKIMDKYSGDRFVNIHEKVNEFYLDILKYILYIFYNYIQLMK